MNKGKKKVSCTHSGCKKYGFLSAFDVSCLDGVPWMCPKHDDQRLMQENAAMGLAFLRALGALGPIPVTVRGRKIGTVNR